MRLHKFFQQQQAVLRARGVDRCEPFRVTPGMYRELCAESGATVSHVRFINTCQGSHPVELITFDTRATGHNVILAPREDLFSEVERDTGVELVSLANSVTSVPDNVACCEILSVGELVQNVKVGDLAFIDFFEVKQGYVLSTDELYIAGCDAFKALFDVENQRIVPLANYVVTRRASERMAVALNGTDRVKVPEMILTSGIAGGKTSDGDVATTVLYEEVVSVGPITKRPMAGLMTKLESQVLDAVVDRAFCERDDLFQRPLETYYEETVALFDALRQERQRGRVSDISPGELVVFCKEMAIPIRVRGEFQHLLPYAEVEAVIDDAVLLDRKIREGKAGRIVRVA